MTTDELGKSKDLLKALLNKIDSILSPGDLPAASPDNYVAWCSPGIPFQPADLQFAVKGLNGKDGKETSDLLRQAEEFARFANAVPASHTIGGTFEQNGTLVWDIYEKVLTFSKVAKGSLTEEEKAKLQEAYDKLYVTVSETDFDTGEKTDIIQDSLLAKAYKICMRDYQAAALAYNNMRLAAMNAESSMAVQNFAINGPIYRNLVDAAMDEWGAKGKKKLYEQMTAFIKQVTQRNMSLIKRDLEIRLGKSRMSSATSGGDFYFTSLYPSTFVNSDNGWTEFTFEASSKDTYLKESKQSTSANAGLKWALFRIGGNGSFSREEVHGGISEDKFKISFKITQIPIGRPWFAPDFLTSNAWDWASGQALKPLSDGGNPPSGQMVAYPTTAIFIKDLKIVSSDMKSVSDEVKKAAEGGGSVGWGPFRFGGSHSSSSHETKTHFDDKTGTLSVDGMQLIAMKCFALPKTPDCKIPTADLE